ncbi:hypothetical protein CEW83_02250 [Parazoarcus communis]|uniref:Uncharacterized protein n=1 Tax=Parazoarcus communis TaxID=41977 RepID=A0A2U8GL64_9RHOO|nr:hypothetical protein [Parazoarcus communis]AWI74188.1 hypothetical protein CEW83_02250 [Parazoarcus communis]
MNRTQLVIVDGDRSNEDPNHWHGSIEHAIASAIQDGYCIGRRVRIGQVEGRVIGFNIGTFGPYHGAVYPLLVSTDLGTAKCRMSEITPI